MHVEESHLFTITKIELLKQATEKALPLEFETRNTELQVIVRPQGQPLPVLRRHGAEDVS